jgi:DNA-binding MurR/RpiR family transcriptional regulator
VRRAAPLAPALRKVASSVRQAPRKPGVATPTTLASEADVDEAHFARF